MLMGDRVTVGDDDGGGGGFLLSRAGFGVQQSTLAHVDNEDDDGDDDDSNIDIFKAAMSGNASRLSSCIAESKINHDINLEINQTDEDGQTPLHMAADKGHVECVSILLDGGANQNAVDDAGISVLTAAVYGGNADVVQLLLEHGADPDQEDEDGDTPRSCAKEGDCDIIQGLFEIYLN